MTQVTASQIVDYVLGACKRATSTGERNEKYSTVRKVFLIQDKKAIVDMIKTSKVMNTKISDMLGEATGENYWTWHTRITNWIMADNKGKLDVGLAVAVQRTTPAPLLEPVSYRQLGELITALLERHGDVLEVQTICIERCDKYEEGQKVKLANASLVDVEALLKSKGLSLDDLKKVL
uniref:Uncharacterized protein n=2 Tax=unclassified bacterial viruses TaxID=12333 RepID=A0AAU6VXT3_9VIRU